MKLYSYVNLCWIMGQMISAGVLEAVSNRTDQWAYKVDWLSLERISIQVKDVHRSPSLYNGSGRSRSSSSSRSHQRAHGSWCERDA